MINQYSLVASRERIQDTFPCLNDLKQINRSYNIIPGNYSAVITNQSPDKIQSFHWGFIPGWTENPERISPLTNARIENISTQSSFRMSIRSKRCVVLADSFYVWCRMQNRNIPFRVLYGNQRIMAMAGVWDVWKTTDRQIKSFSVVSIPSNKKLSKITSRMPYVLSNDESVEMWMDKSIGLTDLLNATSAQAEEDLTYYRISEAIKDKNEDGLFLHERKQKEITLFD